MADLWFIAAVGAFFTLIITPGIRSLALRLGAVKKPAGDDPCQTARPCLGGLALALSFIAISLFASLMFPSFGDSLRMLFPAPMWLLWGALIILAMGIADDLRGFSAMTKLLFQLPAALMVVIAGPEISAIAVPFTGIQLDLAWVSVPLTLLWIVGITNAFNLIDGLDGLAAGTALMASATLVAVSLISGHLEVAVAAAIMAGALMGFLRYNFFPASIFLGDSGSMLLGYLLSVFYISAARDESGAVKVLVPIIALALPIADTTLAVVRRLMRTPGPAARASRLAASVKRLASVFHADRQHIHHRLIAGGLSHRRAVLALYAVCLALSGLALLAMHLSGAGNALLLSVVAAGAFLGLGKLRHGQRPSERRKRFLFP